MDEGGFVRRVYSVAGHFVSAHNVWKLKQQRVPEVIKNLFVEWIDPFNRQYSLMSTFGKNTKKPFSLLIAGGVGKTIIDPSQHLKDIDLFIQFRTPFISFVRDIPNASFEAFKDEVIEWFKKAGYDTLFACPERKLFTFMHPNEGIKIQLICEHPYANVDVLLNSFDFTCTRFALDKTNDGEYVLYGTMQAIRDVKRRYLRIHRVTYPVATMNRIIKMARRGYDTREAVVDFVQRVNSTVYTNEDAMRWYID